MRWLIGLIVVALLLVAGDAALRSYAESRVSARLARELGTDAPVEVQLGGFPFVATALSRRASLVEIEARDIERRGLRVDRMSLRMQGVTLSLGDVDRGVGEVKVERGTGIATLDLDVLEEFIADEAAIGSVRINRRRISARIPQLGRRVRAPLRLERGRIVIGVPSIDDIIVPLPGALANVDYDSIEITDRRAELTFKLENVALRSF